MKWYLSKLIYRIISGNGEHTAQFDEQYRLIHAEDDEDAFQKSIALGEDEEDNFFNNHQQLVQWKFINVADMQSLTNLNHGAELSSRIVEVRDADRYCDEINEKAAGLRERQKINLLQ